MSAMRVTGTRRSSAIRFMLRPSGFMNSSRRISPGWIGISFLAISRSLVIVHDFDCVNVAVSPLKANTPLIVDADAVLPPPVPLQALQPVPRQIRERLQVGRGIQDVQFSQGGSLDRLEPAHRFPAEETLGVRAAERPDHTLMLYCFPLHVNR